METKEEKQTIAKQARNMKVRGQRNNNPLNIIISKSYWVGKINDPSEKKDNRFEEFTDMKYGIRAAVKLLQNYIRKGWDTVPVIIKRWCPDETAPSYTAYVLGRMKGYFPDFEKHKPIRWYDFETLMRLVQAMSKLESQYEITDAEFLEAWQELDNANRSNRKKKEEQ